MAECKSIREVSSVDVTELTRELLLSDVSVDQWYVLGTHLGVKGSVLDAIRAEKDSAQYKMIQMMRKWHDSNTSCSRMDVVEALKNMGLHQTAGKLLASKDPTPELEANGMFYKLYYIQFWQITFCICPFFKSS